MAPPIPRIDQVGVNGIALAFAVAIGSASGLVFGTIPATFAARTSNGSALESTRRSTATAGASRFQKSVVCLEVALTAVILVTGGLLTRSLSQLLAVDPGFESENLATVHVSLPDSRYETQESQAAFVNDVLRELETIPGARAATAANNLPFPGTTAGWGVRGENADPNAPRLSAKLFHVTPGFHETMGIRLVDGRGFTEADGPDGPSVAVVSEEFARRMWPDMSPIGLRVRYPWTTVTVVGVAADVRRETLGAAPELVFYVPFSQFTRPDVSFAVRMSGDAAGVIPQIRTAVWSVDDALAITQSGTMESLIAKSASDERYRTLLMSAFGILASVLAAVGIFGVTARAVSSRTREMGIRMALGQRESGIISNILRGTLVVGLLGTVVGIIGALWASKAVSGLLFNVEASDPVTYAVVACSLLVLCVLASYLPARRIARVDPVDVLRAE
jgi:putative ABC transport system permease protein